MKHSLGPSSNTSICLVPRFFGTFLATCEANED